jgi:hypothetical protein
MATYKDKDKTKYPCTCFGTDRVIGNYTRNKCRKVCRNRTHTFDYVSGGSSGNGKLSTTLKKLWK